MTQRKEKSIFTGLRIPVDLRRQAEQRAEQEGRSLSNYIKNLIRQDLGEDFAEREYHTKKKRRSSG